MSAPETQAELRAEIERLRAALDSSQEHVAYHLRDYALNTEPTGDLAVDMADYAGRMKIRAEVAEAEAAELRADVERLKRNTAGLYARAHTAEAQVARVESLRRNYEARARRMPTPLAQWSDIERDLHAALTEAP